MSQNNSSPNKQPTSYANAVDPTIVPVLSNEEIAIVSISTKRKRDESERQGPTNVRAKSRKTIVPETDPNSPATEQALKVQADLDYVIGKDLATPEWDNKTADTAYLKAALDGAERTTDTQTDGNGNSMTNSAQWGQVGEKHT